MRAGSRQRALAGAHNGADADRQCQSKWLPES